MSPVDQHNAIVNVRQSCAICDGRELDVVMDLPNLPLTGRFTKESTATPDGIDQKLLWCSQCSHAQAAYQVDPHELYNEQYHFRTSRSQTACRGTAFFLNTLDELTQGRSFNAVVDLGCNDLYLLGQLKQKAKHRFGIDPLWKDKEHTVEDKSLHIYGETIEHMDLNKLGMKPDLIVCRHTLEHIYNPKAAFQKLFDAASPGAFFVIEVPSLNGIVHRLRFDQVFHQHVHYFSQVSLRRLMTTIGAHYIGLKEHYHDWGAMCMVFQKRDTRAQAWEGAESFDLDVIAGRYHMFQNQMRTTSQVLESFKGQKLYGYGAAQMLPILAYHLQNDLSVISCVFDDDQRMHGYYYWNLPLRIEAPSMVKDWGSTDIFLTAIDNVQPIMKRLFEHRPRHIIYPLHVI